MSIWNFKLFVRPPESVYTTPDLEYDGGFHSYGEYNYLRPGLVSHVKSAHFERALEWARPHFGTGRVLDFGCADGVFLPSLACHFERVLAIDQVPKFIDLSARVLAAMDLSNVDLLCNEGVPLEELAGRTSHEPCQLGFCLEILEHVGEPGNVYEPKLAVLATIFEMLDKRGTIIVSVPTMIGVPFLIQRLALFATGSIREPLSWSELLRAALLRDTAALEAKWDGGHLGFNHLRLEERIRSRYRIVRRSNLGFQMMYEVARSSAAEEAK